MNSLYKQKHMIKPVWYELRFATFENLPLATEEWLPTRAKDGYFKSLGEPV